MPENDDSMRHDLAELLRRRALTDDAARPDAVERRHEKAGGPRASVADLVDPGTQGALGHRKKDRLFELIERMRLPTVFFAEGGGGRAGGASTCRYGGIGANRDLERQLGEATSAAAAAVAG